MNAKSLQSTCFKTELFEACVIWNTSSSEFDFISNSFISFHRIIAESMPSAVEEGFSYTLGSFHMHETIS